MRIYYVPKGDILVVELGDLRESPGAETLAPGVYLDATDEGKVLALEITSASRFYPREQLEALEKPPAKTFTTAEVARLLSISERAVVQAIGRGRLDATKAGRDYAITAAAINAYMKDRKGTGPRKVAERTPAAKAMPTLAQLAGEELNRIRAKRGEAPLKPKVAAVKEPPAKRAAKR